MPILSPLLGEDFKIKEEHTYITRLLINEDVFHSRIKISFPNFPKTIYPFEFFIRLTDKDGKAISGSPITRELVNSPNDTFIIIVPKAEKLLLIFGFSSKTLEEVENFEFDYKLEYSKLENQIVTDMYMFETSTGIPYQPHSMGSYSEHEFVEKTTFKGKSEYLGKTAVSRIIIGHSHENERGYIDRLYIGSKRGKAHGSYSTRNRGIAKSEETYIYLDPLANTKQITSASNNVIRGLMFLTSDKPSAKGDIEFVFFTKINEEKIYIKDRDIRSSVSMAICKATETIFYKNIIYGLINNLTNPLIIRLTDEESYKKIEFEYLPVFSDFKVNFKGYDPLIQETLDVKPQEIEINKTFSTFTTEKTIENPYGQWDLLDKTKNSVTLYPNFDYTKQNFYILNEFITHTFNYVFKPLNLIFDFIGRYESITLYPGVYKFECWGAAGQGANPTNKTVGSRRGVGGYTKGIIKLLEKTEFYIYVGGHGKMIKYNPNNSGGWNGGGNAYLGGGCGGGGASDIRLIEGLPDNVQSLRSRIMVAGGGGGADDYDELGLDNEKGTGAGGKYGDKNDGSGGHGGGLESTQATVNGILTGGIATQISGYSFGIGESVSSTGSDSGAGAGGYYGGLSTNSNNGGGSGGSSFISGLEGCDAINENGIHTGQPIHYSGLTFEDCETRSGVNDGNGKIRISLINYI